MRVQVMSIRVPAMSTIGFGTGIDEAGSEIKFVGDWRPMRDLGEALQQGMDIEVEIEDWQVTL